jgi:Uma2 family endonuclease
MDMEDAVSDYERERGKPMPSKLHSITQKNLILALNEFEPPYTVFSELTLQLSDRDITPDLSIYGAQEIDFWQDEVRMTEPPLLTVEISSPTQGIQALVNKIRFLLENGVQSCWLVQPQLRTITVYTQALDSKTHSEGTVADPTLDVEVAIDDVFSTS